MFVQIAQNIFPPTPSSEAALSQTFTQRLQKLLTRDRSPFEQADHLAQIRQNRRTCERLLRQHHAFQLQRPSLRWRNVVGQHAVMRSLVRQFAWNIRREAAMQSRLGSRSWFHRRYAKGLFVKEWLFARRWLLLRRLFLRVDGASQRIAFFLAVFTFRSSIMFSAACVGLLSAMVFTTAKRTTQVVATSIAAKCEELNPAMAAASHAIVQIRMRFQYGC